MSNLVPAIPVSGLVQRQEDCQFGRASTVAAEMRSLDGESLGESPSTNILETIAPVSHQSEDLCRTARYHLHFLFCERLPVKYASLTFLITFPH